MGDHATNMPGTVWFGSGANIKDSIKYKYDRCGNICEITENGHIAVKYTYDALNRLVREDNKQIGKTVLYSYDRNGNITERCEYAYTSKSGEELSELDCTHYSYDYEGDKLIAYNGESFVYNSIGNPITYRGKSVGWWCSKRITSFDGTKFAYDGLGRRIKKNDIEFTYDNDGKLLKQSDGLEFVYDASGVVGIKYGNNRYFYRKNAQGDIIAILDSVGKVVVKYVYDAWGNHAIVGKNGEDITEGIGVLNPFRYRGYYYDTETELYYLQTRYYDPAIGRFISQDSVDYADPQTINGINLYAYCGNNPVMNVDPTGEFALTALLIAIIAGAVAGAVIGGVYGATTAVANGQNVGMGILIGAVSGLFLGAIAGFAGYAMAPLVAGTSLVLGMSATASFSLGLGVAVVGGFTVGFAADIATQAVNNNGKIDFRTAALSGVQASVITVGSALFGTLASVFIDSLCVGIGSGILTSTFNMLLDVLRNHFGHKETPSTSMKAYNGI